MSLFEKFSRACEDQKILERFPEAKEIDASTLTALWNQNMQDFGGPLSKEKIFLAALVVGFKLGRESVAHSEAK